MFARSLTIALSAVLASVLAGGCGGSTPAPASSATAATSTTSSAGALAGDANAAATGDIPDTQNFLTFRDSALRISMVYPEGWAVRQLPDTVTFEDKNNLIRIQIARGAAPTRAAVRAQLAALERTSPSLRAGATSSVLLPSGQAVKVTYTTRSAPNAVTGKRVVLMVDRYELGHAGRVAIVDLGTPVGVDNVDAYRKMIGSFRWR